MVQKALQDPLAEMILSGGVKNGERVKVTAGEAGLVIGGALRPLPGAGPEERAMVHRGGGRCPPMARPARSRHCSAAALCGRRRRSGGAYRQRVNAKVAIR